MVVQGGNYEIAPGQAVNFGYILTGAGFKTPNKLELCSKRVSMTTGDETALDIIELSADVNEIAVDSGYRIVYFYAAADLPVENIELISAEDNEKIATMVDNGNYYANGDDMAGDGVFSCSVLIDLSKEHDYYFFARSNNAVSENVNVYVCEELTDAEINAMQE